MRERGDILMVLLVGFILVFPAGFLVHASPRFPGSLGGGLLGILAALCMLLTLPYLAAKHIPFIERRITRYVRKPTLLAVHIYSGVLGAFFALLHTAHKFASPLGLMLTGLLLLTVASGFAGRYLLGELARALRGRKSELASLQSAFLDIPAAPGEVGETQEPPRWLRYVFTRANQPAEPPPRDAIKLAAAISDTEYAVRAEEVTGVLFARWRWFHIVAGSLLYALVILHIAAAVYFGLRWP